MPHYYSINLALIGQCFAVKSTITTRTVSTLLPLLVLNEKYIDFFKGTLERNFDTHKC